MEDIFKMKKHRAQVLIDEDVYQGLKKLPRDVSISGLINLLLKLYIEELRVGRKLTKEELNEWVRKDPERLKLRMVLDEKVGPYFDMIDEAMAQVRGKKNKK